MSSNFITQICTQALPHTQKTEKDLMRKEEINANLQCKPSKVHYKVEKNKTEDIKTITGEIGDQYFTSSSQ